MGYCDVCKKEYEGDLHVCPVLLYCDPFEDWVRDKISELEKRIISLESKQ